VYDPPASLSADRRGTITLPDVECGYQDPAAYTPKVRGGGGGRGGALGSKQTAWRGAAPGKLCLQAACSALKIDLPRNPQERAYVLHHLQHQPATNWSSKGQWSFK
jgi:hypothetical protein